MHPTVWAYKGRIFYTYFSYKFLIYDIYTAPKYMPHELEI